MQSASERESASGKPILHRLALAGKRYRTVSTPNRCGRRLCTQAMTHQNPRAVTNLAQRNGISAIQMKRGYLPVSKNRSDRGTLRTWRGSTAARLRLTIFRGVGMIPTLGSPIKTTGTTHAWWGSYRLQFRRQTLEPYPITPLVNEADAKRSSFAATVLQDR